MSILEQYPIQVYAVMLVLLLISIIFNIWQRAAVVEAREDAEKFVKEEQNRYIEANKDIIAVFRQRENNVRKHAQECFDLAITTHRHYCDYAEFVYKIDPTIVKRYNELTEEQLKEIKEA